MGAQHKVGALDVHEWVSDAAAFQKAGLPGSSWAAVAFNSSGGSNEHPCLRTPKLETRVIGGRKWWRSKAPEKEVHFCSVKFSNFFWGLTAIQEPFDLLEGECNSLQVY